MASFRAAGIDAVNLFLRPDCELQVLLRQGLTAEEIPNFDAKLLLALSGMFYANNSLTYMPWITLPDQPRFFVVLIPAEYWENYAHDVFIRNAEFIQFGEIYFDANSSSVTLVIASNYTASYPPNLVIVRHCFAFFPLTFMQQYLDLLVGPYTSSVMKLPQECIRVVFNNYNTTIFNITVFMQGDSSCRAFPILLSSFHVSS